MDINVFIHDQTETTKLDQILAKLNLIIQKENKMDAAIQAVIDQATANENVEQAANQAIVGLFTALQTSIANAGSLSAADRQTLQAKVTEMQASAASVAAAIVANPATSTGS